MIPSSANNNAAAESDDERERQQRRARERENPPSSPPPDDHDDDEAAVADEDEEDGGGIGAPAAAASAAVGGTGGGGGGDAAVVETQSLPLSANDGTGSVGTKKRGRGRDDGGDRRRRDDEREGDDNSRFATSAAYRRAYLGFRYEPIDFRRRVEASGDDREENSAAVVVDVDNNPTRNCCYPSGTPPSQFVESYRVYYDEDGGFEGNKSRDETAVEGGRPIAIVHRHLNGLAVVVTTAAAEGTDDVNSSRAASPESANAKKKKKAVVRVEFVAKEAPTRSRAEKRKEQGKMLKGKKGKGKKRQRRQQTATAGSGGQGQEEEEEDDDGVVEPADVVANIFVEEEEEEEKEERSATEGGDGSAPESKRRPVLVRKSECRCGVWGTVLELNRRLLDAEHSSLVLRDPMMEGYLAVVLPTGPFPPPPGSPARPTSASAAKGT